MTTAPHKPLRVLYTSFDEVPSPKGASVHIEAFSRALSQRVNLVLVTPGLTDELATESFPGVSHRVLGCPADNPIGRARTFRVKLAQLLATHTWDVIHFRSIFEGYPIVQHYAAQPAGRRPALVYEVNGFPSIELKYHYRKVAADERLTSKLWHQEQRCLEAASRIITVSQVNRQYICERGLAPDTIHLIPNGVASDDFPFRPPLPLDREPLRIAYVGTLTAWQGIDVVLEAIALLQTRRPVHLSLQGPVSKPRKKQLERKIQRLNIETAVTWLSPGGQAEVCRLLHNSHVSVVPLLAVDRNTRQGCCPLKLLEAMAAGCPVVASDLPVVRELAEPGQHFWPARPGDARSLKNALLRCVELPRQTAAMAQRAADHVRRQFTWRHACQRLASVYDTFRSDIPGASY